MYGNYILTALCTSLTYVHSTTELFSQASYLSDWKIIILHFKFVFWALNLYFQAGFLLKYDYKSSEDEVDIHTTRLNIFSPFDALKLLDVNAFIELRDTLYNSNLTLLTEQSHFTAGGYIEVIWLCITEFWFCSNAFNLQEYIGFIYISLL